jgi:hypothetical protein
MFPAHIETHHNKPFNIFAMKTTKFLVGIISLIMLFIMNETSAQQWSNNGNHIYNTNTANVGIGTGALFTPTEKLHINNASNTASIMAESSWGGTSGMHALGYFRIKNTASGDMFNMVLRKNGTVHEMLQSCYDATAGLWREYAYYNYGTRKYEMRSGILDAEFLNSGNFLLSNAGNVGIKTTSPAANLHVAETSPSYTALFGTSIAPWQMGTNVAVGNDNGDAVIYVGQASLREGYLLWEYNATPADAYFSIGTYNGSNNLVLQQFGSKVGIRTATPQALLDVFTDDNSNARLGFTNAISNYFYHSEDPADGDGQAAVFGYRTHTSQSNGSEYANYGVNSAIRGYNIWGDEYSFGTCGFNDLDYSRCGGVMGGYSYGAFWGSLGYKDSGNTIYGGYFTTSTTGVGKSSLGAHINIGLGAWGDLFGADIHGKVYGTFTEGENYALFSNGVVYKNNLDVNLQENGNGTNTPLYTNVATKVTVMTSGIATLSGGKVSIVFDQSFRQCVSTEEPVIVTVTPIGKCNGVFLADVTGTGCSVAEVNDGKSSVTVNYIAIGKRAGYEEPQLAKEVIEPGYVGKLARGLHNDNDLKTNGEGLYYENGQLVVGIHPSTLPDPNKTEEKLTLKQANDNYSGGIEAGRNR